MNKEKLISIIMSVKDGENTVDLAIQSIINQTYSNFEFLIMNDGSADDTAKVLEKFNKKDKRIKIYNNESNLGLTKSLNLLINLSSGEYIARQDADDYSAPERLITQLNYIENLGVDAVTSRANIIGKNKKIPGLSFYLPVQILVRYKNPFIHGSLFIKRDVLNKIGNYNEEFRYSQDYKLFMDLLNSGYKIKNQNKTLYSLNMEKNISNRHASEQKYYFDCARKNIKP